LRSKLINPAGAMGSSPATPRSSANRRSRASAAFLCATLTAFILRAIDATIGLRVKAEDEARGLDLTQHAELAYAATREYRLLDVMSGTMFDQERTSKLFMNLL
jgi:hypothetical protein